VGYVSTSTTVRKKISLSKIPKIAKKILKNIKKFQIWLDKQIKKYFNSKKSEKSPKNSQNYSKIPNMVSKRAICKMSVRKKLF
jgi:hypothetical protein